MDSVSIIYRADKLDKFIKNQSWWEGVFVYISYFSFLFYLFCGVYSWKYDRPRWKGTD